jgi:pilus assembly protein CpaF
VRAKANIVVSGGTSSGKTTFLNVLSSFIPDGERLITIEDAAELRLSKPHVVSLEARPANVEGKGEVTVRELVRNALRMRPDRIIVGEVRGGEALDMLQAMNTGHDGSLSTAHANSPRHLLWRLETMALMSDVDLPVMHMREQVVSALDVVVHMARLPDGRRVLLDVSSVEGVHDGEPILVPTYSLARAPGLQSGFVASGAVPAFADVAASRGEVMDDALFRAGRDVSPSIRPPMAVRPEVAPLPQPIGEFIPETAFALGLEG